MKTKQFGKKQIALAAMVAALGLAVYLNYYLAANAPLTSSTGGTESETTSTTEQVLGESQFVSSPTADQADAGSYFESARESRLNARQEALDIIKDTMQDVKAEDSQKQEAIATAAAVAQAVEQEDAIESLIKAKGFADCVVYIENDNCHIVVQAQELDQSQLLQITEIVTAQSSVTADHINIIPIAP